MMTTQLTHLRRAKGRILLPLLLFNFLTAAAPRPKLILFLGDSVTAGYGLEPSQAYPALIQEKIEAKRWQFKTVNAGQSGDTSAGGLNRLDWLLRSRVDVLVLELGANDGLRGLPVETTKKNLQAIIDRTKSKYPDSKVILAGMKVPPNMGGDYGKRFEAIFTELAKKNKPEAVREKILQGKLAKRFEEICLLNQKYIKDDSKTVQDYVSETIARIGENIVVRRFIRFEVGASN